MRKATLARAIKESAIEIRSYEGKRKRASRYLVIKGRVRNTDFFKIFAAAELKEACLDILGLQDAPEFRRRHANELARKVWYGKGVMRFPRLRKPKTASKP